MRERTVVCVRCGKRWLVDPAELRDLKSDIYKGAEPEEYVETYRLVCPHCGAVNMVDFVFSEGGGDA